MMHNAGFIEFNCSFNILAVYANVISHKDKEDTEIYG